MSASIFGLALTPLFMAIAQVESDRGATSENPYQIRKIYVDDLNRIYGDVECRNPYNYAMRLDWQSSEIMMLLYWKHYAHEYAKRTGGPITYEVLARIHNGGPHGAERRATLAYWRRVGGVLKEIANGSGGETKCRSARSGGSFLSGRGVGAKR